MESGENFVSNFKEKDDLSESCEKIFYNFIKNFAVSSEKIYLEDAILIASVTDKNTLMVNFQDLEEFNQSLAIGIQQQYYRVYPSLVKALNSVINEQPSKKHSDKEYYVGFHNLPTHNKIRELTCENIGKLLRITGQLVRTHPVHPELISATFICLECQSVIKNVEQQFKFTQPSVCRNTACNNRAKFLLDIHASKFADFQKLRIQETQAELPRGCIPRSLELILRGDIVDTVQAGDQCEITGTLLVIPDVSKIGISGSRLETSARIRSADSNSRGVEGVVGLKTLGVRDLSYRLGFLVSSIKSSHMKFGSLDLNENEVTAEIVKQQMTEIEWKKVYEMTQDVNLYKNLINSLFPAVYGILLMLMSGVGKKTLEKTHLRGDINICIIGDPSTAKSQLLKCVEEFSPRAVYTSGKASTAAGLTAAVVRDESSHEFVIEAGALMLADSGICCIDEFDKMDLKDQIAIHEAMEQQTISITKAGVKATLNARTSVLAAANPIGGRYDPTKSLNYNLNLSAPIMSRFDLFFILIDQCNEIVDLAVANRIMQIHCEEFTQIAPKYTYPDIRNYIMFAKKFKPQMSESSREFLVDKYKQLRKLDASKRGMSTRVTVRQLESLIRLSEALARLYCCDTVDKYHVQEAYNLLNKSLLCIEQPEVHLFEDVIPDDEILNHAEQFENNAFNTNPQALHDELNDERKTKATDDRATKKIKLSYDEYKRVVSLLILHLQTQELMNVETSEADLKQWYLSQIEEEIKSEEELIEKTKLIEKVIERLIVNDNVIIRLKSSKARETSDTEDMDTLIVHPNYNVDDF